MFTKANVISAKFINEEHTTIEVLHTSKDDKNVRPYVLEYDKDSADFKALAKAGWDLEAVTDATAEYKREASSMWNNAINEAAVEMNKTNKPVTIANDEVMNKVLELNEDEDTLFKAKLTIMELDIVKKSKKTKVKSDIRKAKSLIEVIAELNKL
jgi:hypothetical protein|tara:strand:+ start:97 stop:561 length:465 start_codon:yes stop_codon:yes gene_type:complete